MSHDRNFKNPILDYPREASAFFAAAEETDPGRFSNHRPAHHGLDLADLFSAERALDEVVLRDAPARGLPHHSTKHRQTRTAC